MIGVHIEKIGLTCVGIWSGGGGKAAFIQVELGRLGLEYFSWC